jgi:DUF4097 and DUF4098 domain-containing protein YvlB
VATGLRGDVEASSVSGDVRLRDVTGHAVEARSVSGDLELLEVRAEEVGAETVSGDVVFSGEVRRGGEYDFQTLSGDVVLRLPAAVGAEVTASTFSGAFDSAFRLTSRAERRSRFGPNRQRVSGTLGGGGATIRVESFSGNIELREAGR